MVHDSFWLGTNENRGIKGGLILTNKLWHFKIATFGLDDVWVIAPNQEEAEQKLIDGEHEDVQQDTIEHDHRDYYLVGTETLDG